MIERAFSIDIKAPAQRVWDEITQTGAVCQAMFGTVPHGSFAPGGVISYRSADGKNTFVVGEVLEVQAPSRLVHTFRFSMQNDPPTLVVWELREAAGVTRVTVTHSRFVGETKTYKSVTGGWPKILAIYKTQIETGHVPMGVRLSNWTMGALSFMIPKSARTETVMQGSNKLE